MPREGSYFKEHSTENYLPVSININVIYLFNHYEHGGLRDSVTIKFDHLLSRFRTDLSTYLISGFPKTTSLRQQAIANYTH